MFKKPVKIGAQNQLSGKDKKSIKNKLVHQFDPETVQKIFSTYDKIICNKISGSKMLIYTTDEFPLFVDGTGKEDYFLSVYTCTAFETLAKSLYINEGVEDFIFNGANLMWPGVRDLSRLGNFKKDEIVAIKNSKNEVIAVGALGCSLDELKTKTDGNGIAVYILNFKGDKLWDMGSKVYPEAIVKAKEEKIEVVVEQKVEEKAPVPAPKEESSSEEEVEVKKDEVKPKGKGPAQKQKKEESEDEKPEQPVKGKGKGKKDKKAQKNESEEQQKVQEAPKGKGKGKKQKKVESDQQKPEEPVKAKGKGKKEAEQKPEEPQKGKGKGKKDKKVESQEEIVEEPVKGKGKGKKQKKVESEEEVVEEPVKGKGKGKKDTKQAKPEPKPEPKKKEQSESDDQVDFGNLVHTKPAPRVQVKVEKKVIQFSDEEDDKKGKKKGGKKGGNKKKQSEDEEEVPKPAAKGKKQQSDNESEEEVKEAKKGHNKGKNKKKDSDEQEIEEKPEKKKGKGKKKQEVEEQENNEDEVKPEKKEQEGQQENQEGAKSAINSQLMDEYFKEAFLNVLKLCKIEAELPIDSGRFFSDYMVLARPEGVKLDIKDTSFKKLGKFYEEMAKKKIIEFKPAKEKKGQQGSTITKILWQNEELKNYFPTIKKMGEKDVEEKVEEYSKEKLKLSKTLQIDYVYKPSQQLKKILFKKVINYMPDKSEDQMDEKEEKKDIYLSERDLKEKIEKYINEITVKDAKEAKEPKQGKQGKEGKQGKDKDKKVEKIITLNYKQNAFIYGLLKSQIEEYEQNLEKEEMMAQQDSDQQEKKKGKKDKNKRTLFKIERGVIVNKIFKLASPYYNLSDKTTGLNKFKEGVFKGIQLIADKVINKNVTKIIGIESFAPSNVQPEELVKQIHGFAHQLQVKFASSATVQNLPGKNAGKEIVVQGNFVDELEALFTTEFGIKKDHITIQNKLGKKKKN